MSGPVEYTDAERVGLQIAEMARLGEHLWMEHEHGSWLVAWWCRDRRYRSAAPTLLEALGVCWDGWVADTEAEDREA